MYPLTRETTKCRHVVVTAHIFWPVVIAWFTLAGIPGSPSAIAIFWWTPQAVQSCRVQSEGVKNESKGLQETGLPARFTPEWKQWLTEVRNKSTRENLMCQSNRMASQLTIFVLPLQTLCLWGRGTLLRCLSSITLSRPCCSVPRRRISGRGWRPRDSYDGREGRNGRSTVTISIG